MLPLTLTLALTPFLTLSLPRSTADTGSNTFLRQVRLYHITKAECNGVDVYDNRITDAMMCAGHLTGGKDSCQVGRVNYR